MKMAGILLVLAMVAGSVAGQTVDGGWNTWPPVDTMEVEWKGTTYGGGLYSLDWSISHRDMVPSACYGIHRVDASEVTIYQAINPDGTWNESRYTLRRDLDLSLNVSRVAPHNWTVVTSYENHTWTSEGKPTTFINGITPSLNSSRISAWVNESVGFSVNPVPASSCIPVTPSSNATAVNDSTTDPPVAGTNATTSNATVNTTETVQSELNSTAGNTTTGGSDVDDTNPTTPFENATVTDANGTPIVVDPQAPGFSAFLVVIAIGMSAYVTRPEDI